MGNFSVKHTLKNILFLSILLLLANNTYTQDIIHFQYKDSISGKVLAINKNDVIYQSQEFYDSGVYAINRHKVTDVKYANGKIVPVSNSRWNKFYRPAVFLTVGQYEYELANNYSIQNTALGLGHKGFFRLFSKGLGIIYNADFSFGQYGFYTYNANVYTSNESGYYYSVNLFAGLEYRYSLFRGLGFYTDFQAGKSYVNYYDRPAEYYSNNLLFSGSTGIYMFRYQVGLKFSWGQLNKQSTLDPNDIMQSMSSYDIAEISFYIAFAF